MATIFKVRINDGEEQDLTVNTSIYKSAVAAVPAIFGIEPDEFPIKVTIWWPKLLPHYGPYDYWIEDVGHAVCVLAKGSDGEMVAIR